MRKCSSPEAGSRVGSVNSELVEARSRPTIEGWALAFSRRTLASCSSVEITPRIAPLSLRCRVKRSEEHTSEFQSRQYLVCRLLLEKKTKEHHLHHTALDDYDYIRI